MRAEEAPLETYRTDDEKLVVYDSGMPCAFVVSDTTVDVESMA